MKFFDTNALLNVDLNNEEDFLISSVTLEELESIKTNKNKTDELRYQARKVTRWLSENEDKYEVVMYTEDLANALYDSQIAYDSPDAKICVSAASKKEKDIVFVTNDLCCKNIASNIFGLNVATLDEKVESEYTGFKEIVMCEEDMAYFYEHRTENIYNLLKNQYLIVKQEENEENETVDIVRWDGERHVDIFREK